MPKIRGVKPEFWTADGILELSMPARLLFIGLWNYACDNGHLRDKPRQIKTRLLPGDDVKVSELLDEMVTAEQIVRENGWITIPDLTAHQKPHKRWWATCEKPGCTLPDGASHAPSNRGATVAQPLQNSGATADGDGDGDGEVKGGRKRRATPFPDDWRPTAQHQQYATENGINLNVEASKFHAHAIANDRRLVSWNAAFTQWLLSDRTPRNLRLVNGEGPDDWMRR